MKIVPYPHPSLRTKAEPITMIDQELHVLAGQMLELMYKHEGLGLASPQVAVGRRMIVMNFAGDANEKDKEHVAINPVILETKGAVEDREGCLSFPGLYAKVRRFQKVRVQAYNLRGELYEMTCTDLAARIWQHEIDHLDAALFIDKLGLLARRTTKKAIEEFQRDFQKALDKGEYPPGTAPKL